MVLVVPVVLIAWMLENAAADSTAIDSDRVHHTYLRKNVDIQVTSGRGMHGKNGGGCSSYGCGSRFNRAHSCQCNAQCTQHGNCCADYSSVCQRSLNHDCSGSKRINFYGHGCVDLVNAKWNVPGELAGSVHVGRNQVQPYLKGRTYFSTVHSNSTLHPHNYLAIQLLGKRFSYTTDISGVGCGCNAAVYFTSMHQEKSATKCGDFYCDAARVCGASCAEIDVQESNMFAYRATLHSNGDETG